MPTWTAYLDTDFEEPLTLEDSAEAVFDLTGYTVTAEVREFPGGALLATATITVVSAVAGTVNFGLTDTQVNAIGIGNRGVDLKVVRDSDSFIYRSEFVKLQIEKRVTA